MDGFLSKTNIYFLFLAFIACMGVGVGLVSPAGFGAGLIAFGVIGFFFTLFFVAITAGF